ncbi:MFS transporter [Blastococcus montanus]|uniref:MFS transporter n=1 Tax=Blastococcus montanus TaxID=3144973 RepID=UPI0032096FC7
MLRGDFLVFAAGALSSGVGVWMLRLGQTLVLLQVPGASGWTLGLLAALQMAPVILLSPAIGALADRVPRVRLLLAGQILMTAVAAVEGARVLLGSYVAWQSLALAAALGLAATFDHPVRLSTVADILPPPQLSRGVGAVVVTTQLGRVIGPALCAALTAAFGLASVFVACVALFGVFTAVLVTPGVRGARRSGPRGGGLRRALRSIRDDRRLRAAFWFVGFGGVVGPNLTTLSALMVDDVFGGGPPEVSLAALALAVGAVGGALVTTLRRRVPSSGSLALATLACGATAGSSGLAPNYASYLAVLVLSGAAAIFMAAQGNALVQVVVPDDVRGMVSALFTTTLIIGVPLGSPLLGWGADVLGPRWSAGLAGVVVVGAACLVWGGTRDTATASEGPTRASGAWS